MLMATSNVDFKTTTMELVEDTPVVCYIVILQLILSSQVPDGADLSHLLLCCVQQARSNSDTYELINLKKFSHLFSRFIFMI